MTSRSRKLGRVGGGIAAVTLGADVLAERTFGGYTVPSDLQVGWWYRTERPFPFFRATLSQATHLPTADIAAGEAGRHVAVAEARAPGFWPSR